MYGARSAPKASRGQVRRFKRMHVPSDAGFLGDLTKLGVAAVFGKFALGAGSAAGSGGSGGIWKDIVGAGKDALIGGIRSGFSKRIDAQIAGRKAALYGGTPAGALQLADSRSAGELAAAQFSSQAESQGQYLSWLAEQKASDQAFQASENAKDRALTLAIYGGNGQQSEGQRVSEVLVRPLERQWDRMWEAGSRRARNAGMEPGRQRSEYIGSTRSGRHYGSNW